MKEYIFLYLIIFFSSCNNNNNNIIRRLESSPIELSLDQIKFIKASFDSKQEQIDSGGKITLLVYSDSIVCNPCVLKTMHYWIDIIDEFKKNTNGSLNQIFIFNPKVADINKIDRKSVV